MLLPRYTTVYRGEVQGTTFFVLLRGRVRLSSIMTSATEERGAGDVFGEESLVGLPRSHTVATVRECTVLQFDAPNMEGVRGHACRGCGAGGSRVESVACRESVTAP